MNVVTDTHPWVWFLTANSRLSVQARTILSDPANLIVVPSIVILEIKYLYRRKRIPLPFEDAVGHMEATPNVLFYPLEFSVVSLAPASLDIHDAIIVGTALHSSNGGDVEGT